MKEISHETGDPDIVHTEDPIDCPCQPKGRLFTFPEVKESSDEALAEKEE